MDPVERFASGGPWESRVGYSRTVRAGAFVLVAGCTAATEDGAVRGLGDPFAQAEAALAAGERALALAGATLSEVVRTRMYVTDIGQWEAVGRAHAACFSEIRPVATMVEVSALIDPRLLVEVEIEAYSPQ
jgi:enamine deaminase RidA (YjgF/YER057c/UK114 family)